MSLYALYSSAVFQIPDLLPHNWLVSLIDFCAGLVKGFLKVQTNDIIPSRFPPVPFGGSYNFNYI